MITIKMSNRGQITIPRAIRRQVGLKPGDSIALIPEGDRVVLWPITQTLIELRGSLPVAGPQDFTAVRRQVASEKGKQAGGRER